MMKKKELMITPPSPGTEINLSNHLLLGKWNLIGDLFHSEEELDILPYHWDNRRKFKRDFYYIQSLNQRVIESLAAELNLFHGTSYSNSYWTVILGPWVNIVLVTLFDRWEVIGCLLYANRQWTVSSLERSKTVMVPAGFSDADEIYSNDDWNDSVFRSILNYRTSLSAEDSSTCSQANLIALLQPNVPIAHEAVGLSGLLRYSVAKILLHLWGAVSSVTLIAANYSASQAMKLRRPEHILWPLIFQKLNDRFADIAPNTLNARWRQGALGLRVGSDNPDFEQFINVNLRSMLPWLYLESFNRLTDLSAKLPWPRRPECIVTAHGQYSNEAMKVWVAATKERSHCFKYVLAQHSWGYFFFEADSYMALEMRVGDAFLGWGEASAEHPKGFHLPTGRIVDASLTLSHDPLGGILFTLMSFSRYAYMQKGMPIGPQSYDLIKSHMRLLDCLDDSIREEIILRRYPVEFEYQDSRRIFEAFPDIKLDLEKDLSSSVKKARLVVCDAYSSVWLQCLTADVPVIGLVDPNLFVPVERYEPLLNELIEVGLICDKVEMAAVFLNQIGPDTTKWWQGVKLRATRDKFLKAFAKTDSNWVNTWHKTLAGIINP